MTTQKTRKRKARRSAVGRSAPAQAPRSNGAPAAGKGPELLWLDPKAIVWPETRITSHYGPADTAALSESLQGVGQQQPVGVYLVDGKYIGADGMNRCQVAIESGAATILCVVREGQAKDVLQSNIATALLRGHTNPLSVAEVMWKAYNEEGVDIFDLAKSAGRSTDWVEAMLLVSQSSPVLKQALGDELIAMGHAELLSAIEDRDEQEEALRKQLMHRWTIPELEAYLRGDETTPERRTRRSAGRNPLACNVCHTEHEPQMIQTMNICSGCLEGLGEVPVQVAVLFQTAMDDLRQAESLLAASPEGAPVAERLSALVERVEEILGRNATDSTPGSENEQADDDE